VREERQSKEQKAKSKHHKALFLFFAFYFLIFALPLSAASPNVLLSTTTLLPGQTLRVELDGVDPSAKLKVLFSGKLYPFYAVGPNAVRALIGVPLGSVPGVRKLVFRKSPSSGASVELPEGSYEVDVATRVYTVENVNFTSEKTDLMKSEHNESSMIHRANQFLSRDQQWEGVFMYPVDGPVIGEFGLKRTRNVTIDAGFHKGVDLRAKKGTPVQAANSGMVVLAAHLKAHGNIVMINHGQGVMTIYLHMQSIKVKLRQKVHKGEAIGLVGSTGLSTAPHVHFEVFVHGVPVDPQQWIETEF
jgi:murein DD-endopeptidase MepM/ murein hydrolase activator NlpD